ncbi:MAG: polar amino acid transport system permease protein [Frankiales bacterium]|nr:polar amino acid transport system permease protein [Frankiales bacterium]
MSTDTTVLPGSSPASQPAPPEQIRAVPVRHPGRWVGTAVIAVLVAMFVHMLVTNSHFEWRFMADNMFTPPVLGGVETTLIMTVLAMIIGVLLGIVFAVMRLSPNPVLSGAAWVYVWFFRAIPRYVLLFLVSNLGILYATYTVGIPFGHQLKSLVGLNGDVTFFGLDGNQIFGGFTAGLLGLALSEAAYMAEIVRAGMQSVDGGQTEAASALGMSRTTTLRRIVLPQAMRVIIPPTGNETIAMLKDTSLLIAVPVTTELSFQLRAIGSRTFQIIPMAVAAILWYLALASVLMIGQYFIERRFSRGFGTRETRAQRAERTARTVGGTH